MIASLDVLTTKYFEEPNSQEKLYYHSLKKLVASAIIMNISEKKTGIGEAITAPQRSYLYFYKKLLLATIVY